jgi:hypothetical protein
LAATHVELAKVEFLQIATSFETICDELCIGLNVTDEAVANGTKRGVWAEMARNFSSVISICFELMNCRNAIDE